MATPSHAELLREYLEQLSQPGAESRLPAWNDWLRLRALGGAVAIGAALVLSGCDDSDTGGGNAAGAAGVQTTTGTGGTSVATLYGAPMTGGTGGTSATTTTSSGGIGSVTALYAVVMEGGSSSTETAAGGTTAGVRYGMPLVGGSSAAQGGTGAASATGGTSMVALYMAPIEQGIASPGTSGS